MLNIADENSESGNQSPALLSHFVFGLMHKLNSIEE